MKRERIIAALGALAIYFAGVSGAFAQGGALTNARREFKITQNVIDKVQRLVEESDNRRAEDALRRAVDTQRKAEHELARQAAVIARGLTLVARNYALRAGKLAGEPSENREFVFRQLQRTRDLLRRAREGVRDEDGPRVTDLLRTAFGRQDEAEASFREQQFRVALRMTYVARELARKALDMTKGEPGRGRGNVEEAVRRTDEVLRRVSRGLGDARPPLLDEAFRLQDRAETHMKAGRLGPAYKLTLTARDLAIRARREETEGDGPGAVHKEIDATSAFLESAQRAARESGSDEALELVRQAYSHLDEARAHLEKRELVPARAQLKLARRKAEKALEVAGG